MLQYLYIYQEGELMKLKTFTKLIFILGLTLLVTSLILPPVLLVLCNAGTSVGFIGTGDISKFKFITMLLHLAYTGWPTLCIILGATLLVISALCKFCKNAIANYMSIKTTLCALIFSFASGLILCSLYNLFVIVIADLPSAYPKFASAIYIYRTLCIASIIGAVIGLISAIIVAVIYARLKKKSFTLKGLLMDIGFSLLCFPFFFLMLSFLSGLLTL